MTQHQLMIYYLGLILAGAASAGWKSGRFFAGCLAGASLFCILKAAG